MGTSEKAMEWVLGKPLPKPSRRTRSPYRQRKVVVHVETSDSEYCSDTSSDESSFTTMKRVRFKNDTKEGSDSKDDPKAEEKKKSALKKHSGKGNSDASSGEECACCKGYDKSKDDEKDSSKVNNSTSEDRQSK